jgi:hypothetical protein
MKRSNTDSTERPRRNGVLAPSADSGARATRARDHLERKRRQERKRIERARNRAESASDRAHVRAVVTPILFGFAVAMGVVSAGPLREYLLFREARLERVAVQGASTLRPLEVARSLGIEPGRPVNRIDPIAFHAAAQTEPWIESIRALRLPTGTLIVSVVERQAVARWARDSSSEVELIDRHGERFRGSPEPAGALPLIHGGIPLGDLLPASAIEILDEVRRHGSLTGDPNALTLHLPDNRKESTAGNPSGEAGYVLQLGDGGPRALLGQRFLVKRIARLAALIESEEAQLAHTETIDLRYADRAVLQTEPTSG